MKRKVEKGYILIIVLVLVSILLAMAYYFAEGLFSELTIARNNKGSAVAFSLAEAGAQEAIYRVQHESGIKDVFMNSEDGQSHFSHDPALINNGAYDVTIKNSAKGVATITSVGIYKIGALRTAKRQIKVGIAQANSKPYPYDGAIFSGGGAGNSIADIDFWFAPVQIFGGSLLSNRDINFKFGSWANIEKTVEASRNVDVNWSISNCNCQIIDGDYPGKPMCSSFPGCSPLENQPDKVMPSADFDSAAATSLKQRAIAEGHYFAKQNDFLTNVIFPKASDRTFSGVYYIDDSLDIDFGRVMRMNGILATTGSINISFGQLIINPAIGGSENGAAGAFTQKDFKVGSLGNLSGLGLVYAGDRIQIDSSIPYVMNFTGGWLSRRTWITGFRIVNLHFDSDIINNTLNLFGSDTITPVIEINHWEEEY